MRSHEARPSSVPTKLELWGAVNTAVPPSQNFGGDSPFLSPHDLLNVHSSSLLNVTFEE